MQYNEEIEKKNEGLDQSSKGEIKLVPIDKLSTFFRRPLTVNPFQPYSEEKMVSLEKSIAEIGLQQPVIVKTMNPKKPSDGYLILSGHNRTQACKNLGWTQIPAIVQDVDDNHAALIAVQSNFEQRGELLHSERAKGYLALKQMTTYSFPVGTEDSRTQIYRYLKLNELLPELLALVDTEEIPFQLGVEVAHFDPMEQALIYNFFYVEKRARLSLKMAVSLRRMCKKRKLCQEDLDNISRATVVKPKEAGLSIPYSKISELYEELPSDDQLCEFILDLLRLYANNEAVREAYENAS